jgi:transposase-like protein
MSATALDAFNGILLLAISLTDVESIDNYNCFLRFLKTAVPLSDGDDVVFFSDRSEAIKSTIRDVFKNGVHCYCANHIKDNTLSVMARARQMKKKDTVVSLFFAFVRTRFPETAKRLLARITAEVYLYSLTKTFF